MKLGNIQMIYDDFKRVKNQVNSDKSDTSHDVANYFDPQQQYLNPLANNHGQLALSEYIEFVYGELFCESWIAAKGDPKKAEARSKLEKEMSKHFNMSGFSKEMMRLIKEGAMYNDGLFQTNYKYGLEFKTIKNESLYMSKGYSEAHRRAYAVRWIPLMEAVALFEGEIIETISNQLNMHQSNDMLYQEVELIAGIIPLDEDEDKADIKKGYRFKRCYILNKDDIPHKVTKKDEKIALYKTFPLMHYAPQLENSLAALALTRAVKADEYDVLIAKQARKVTAPAYSLARSTFLNNSYDLGENGLVPLSNTERVPAPIESAQRFNLTAEDIARHERAIDRTFKIDLIQRAKVTNLSQFEAASNYLNAMKAIAPSAIDLVNKVPSMVLERAHSLLMQNDSKYRKLAAEAGDIDWSMSGWTEKMRRLEQAVGLGRVMQGAAPFLQADPSAAQKLKGDVAIEMLTESWNVPRVSASDQEVAEEREAAQKQQQELMKTAQAQQGADLEQTQAQTEAIKNPQGG